MLSMASHPVVASLSVAEVRSYIRGYHAYMESWSPSIDDVLVLKREPDNPKQSSAVAVIKYGDVIGHVPYNIAPPSRSF